MYTQAMRTAGHEELAVFTGEGYRAFISIHSTRLGPALGGTRRWPYASEQEAVRDVLRLSEAMTYKAAVAGMPLGGGKAVIWCDGAAPAADEARWFGECVERMAGRYVTAVDVGTNEAFMDWAAAGTRYVTGRPVASGGVGSPSPSTAHGVFAGIVACLERIRGSGSLSGRTIAVQGVGEVGGPLVEQLAGEGARVIVADVAADRVRALCERFPGRVTPTSAETILTTECDVLAPCALGGGLNRETIPQLRCQAVAGAANNQLAQPPEDAARLAERGILYAPDFVINAGGLIHVGGEWLRWTPQRVQECIGAIAGTLRQIFRAAGPSGNTHAEAIRIAQRRIEAGSPTA